MCVAIDTVVMVMRTVHVTCGLLMVAVIVMTSVAMADPSSSTERDDDADETAAVIEALARALQRYRRTSHELGAGQWLNNKREAALDVDYGWGGGRFGKRRMADRLGIAGRFGRSVDAARRSSSSSTA